MNPPKKEPAVIHEDNHIIVIDKPPLLATMGVSEGEESLVTWTKAWLKQKHNKPGNVYLGVVSRLDSFTTGLIVLAKTSKAAGRMTKQFQQGLVEKTYTAILESPPPEEAGSLVDWIVKDDQRRRMIVVDSEEYGSSKKKQGERARRAEMEYRVVGKCDSLTLVSIKLLTGRKHQIRLQFSSRGCPVLGDRKYDGQLGFYSGIALQSSTLAFPHPVGEGERMSFRIDPPKRWNLARFTRK